jgi:phage-related protein
MKAMRTYFCAAVPLIEPKGGTIHMTEEFDGLVVTRVMERTTFLAFLDVALSITSPRRADVHYLADRRRSAD